MSNRAKALLALHIAVFLWGFTAILGKLISYGSITLVWHRMLLTSAIYLLIPAVWKSLKGITPKTIITFALIGLVVCAHWLTFYGSIKLGNSVSITLACLGSASFFASIIEPLVLKQPFSKRDMGIGLFVILGILLIYWSSQLSNAKNNLQNTSVTNAILTGLLSAALAATFTSLNKKYISTAHPLAISTIEMISGAVALTIIIPFYLPEIPAFPSLDLTNLNMHNVMDGPWDIIWILILAILCTNLTFYLGTYALNHLSAFTSNLTVNLEPIYGIILGAVIFNENKELNSHFYLGTSMILLAIFTQAYLSTKKNK